MAVAEPTTESSVNGALYGTRVPTVIVDNVHITYKIHTAPQRRAGSPLAALTQIMNPGRAKTAMREVKAVRGVSFVAYEGEAIGLIGSNGSGKSTLLRSVAGLLPVASGRIYTRGQPSMLGVGAVLLRDLTGERNVTLGCLAMGMSRDEVIERAPGIIEFSGINDRGDFSSLPMKTYSSGMSARLSFSIAAAKKHEVLLVDEALATGDASFSRRSEQRVRELREEAGTVILVSHSLGSVRSTCKRSIWLESGLIKMDGPTEEVLQAYEAYMQSK
jgi:teichoic acid transport system ATP-binding protein